jgi:hypothetical protein
VTSSCQNGSHRHFNVTGFWVTGAIPEKREIASTGQHPAMWMPEYAVTIAEKCFVPAARQEVFQKIV